MTGRRLVEQLIGGKAARWVLVVPIVAGLLYGASTLALLIGNAPDTTRLGAEPKPDTAAAYQPWNTAAQLPAASLPAVQPASMLGEPPGPEHDEFHGRPAATVANAPLSTFPGAAVTPAADQGQNDANTSVGAGPTDSLATAPPRASTPVPPSHKSTPPDRATSTARPPATNTVAPPPSSVLPTLPLPTLGLPLPTLPVPTSAPPPTSTLAPIIVLPTLAIPTLPPLPTLPLPLPTLAIPTLPPLLP